MSDLTMQEQVHVRTALRYLRMRCGGWEPLARGLHLTPKTLTNVAHGQAAGASLVFRLARFASVPVDDVLAGKYPPAGTCPHCGHRAEPGSVEASAAMSDR